MQGKNNFSMPRLPTFINLLNYKQIFPCGKLILVFDLEQQKQVELDKYKGEVRLSMGIAAKNYAESETETFLSYFIGDNSLTSSDFDNCLTLIAGEIAISAESNERQEIDNLITTIRRNCTDCPQNYIELIDRFELGIIKYSP